MPTGLDLSWPRSLYLLALDNKISLENRCPVESISIGWRQITIGGPEKCNPEVVSTIAHQQLKVLLLLMRNRAFLITASDIVTTGSG